MEEAAAELQVVSRRRRCTVGRCGGRLDRCHVCGDVSAEASTQESLDLL
jgi:hypothetical protein